MQEPGANTVTGCGTPVRHEVTAKGEGSKSENAEEYLWNTQDGYGQKGDGAGEVWWSEVM